MLELLFLSNRTQNKFKQDPNNLLDLSMFEYAIQLHLVFACEMHFTISTQRLFFAEELARAGPRATADSSTVSEGKRPSCGLQNTTYMPFQREASQLWSRKRIRSSECVRTPQLKHEPFLNRICFMFLELFRRNRLQKSFANTKKNYMIKIWKIEAIFALMFLVFIL